MGDFFLYNGIYYNKNGFPDYVNSYFPDILYFIKKVNFEFKNKYKEMKINKKNFCIEFNGKKLSPLFIINKDYTDLGNNLESMNISIIDLDPYLFPNYIGYTILEYNSFSRLDISIFNNMNKEYCYHDDSFKTGLMVGKNIYEVHNRKDLDHAIDIFLKFISLYFYNIMR